MKNKTSTFAPIVLSHFLLAAAAPLWAQTTATTKPAASKPAIKTAPKPVAVPSPFTWPTENGLYAGFDTTMGVIIIKFYEKEAPVTVKNFTSLARGTREFTDPKSGQTVKRPFYNGITFHRVIPGFMIQGGDPLGTGMGSGGVKNIIDEFDPALKFDQPGRLAMANIGQPNTGSTQFFITDGMPEYLNNKHTIFGQVITGQEIVHQIAATPRDPGDKPLTPVVMKTVVIHRVGPSPDAPVTTSAKPAAKPTTKAVAKPAVKTAATTPQ